MHARISGRGGGGGGGGVPKRYLLVGGYRRGHALPCDRKGSAEAEAPAILT